MHAQLEKFFVDNCLAPQLAAMLSALGVDVIHIADVAELERDAEDIVWIPWVASHARVALTLDTKMSTRPHEKEALRRAGLRVVYLADGVANLKFWLQARFLVSHCEDIEREVSKLQVGECIRVRMRGRIERR
jgi:predicted nuclease of predicted toxin-antitoxin system